MSLNQIQLSHGSGIGLQNLLHTSILPILAPVDQQIFEDAAILPYPWERFAMTTDSFVVSPVEFKGGDIGKLAACGTINDLSMMGAQPLFMTVSLIIEEGCEIDLLKRVLTSLRYECDQLSVKIVSGDTKVVDHSKADQIFITTTGIGAPVDCVSLSASKASVGDVVIVNGPIGLHGIAVLSARNKLGFVSDACSDCAALWPLVQQLLLKIPETTVLRDATRGGCAAVLNEIAVSSKVTIRITERNIPVPAVVSHACSFLGLDPLHIANEGRFIAIVPHHKASEALELMQSHPLGCGAAIIGTVIDKTRFPVIMETSIGGTRPVDVPSGQLLPRIC